MKPTTKFFIPATGTTCAEAIMGSPNYIPCGKPAKFVVIGSDQVAIAMCSMCSDHNVKNRGAKLAPLGFAGKVLTAQEIVASLKPQLPVADVEDDESGPTDQQLKTIAANVSRALTLQQLMIPKAEEELAKLQAELKNISEVVLPNALTDAKIAAYTYMDRNDGKWEVELESDVKASIPKDKVAAFIEYLTTRKEDDLVKRKIVIKFGRDQVKLAKKFLADLAKRKVDLHPEINEEVNWQTLNSYVRERRQDAIDHQRDPDQELPPSVTIFKMRYVKFARIEEKKGVSFL